MIESHSYPYSPRSGTVPGARLRVLASALVLGALLAACAPVAVRPTANVDGDALQAAREASLAAQTQWSFTGRVALSQGKEGGSGRIEWAQRGEDFDIRLSAPITRQSWRLVGNGGQVRLEGLDGGAREGADAEALLLDATGWRVPVKAMAAWVRGLRADGPANLRFDPQGRPAALDQQGWNVEYRDWSDAEPSLPARVFARRDQATVRLVIDRWQSP